MKAPNPKSLTQAARQQIRDESVEFLKVAKSQVAGPEEPRPNGAVPGVVDSANAALSSEVVNPEEIKSKERVLMGKLEEELSKVRREEAQKYVDWKESQEEQMKKGQNDGDEPPIVAPAGKQKRGPAGPAGGRLKHAQNKTEMGRQAKN